MITKFKDFLNEGLLDKMKPKSEEQISSNISNELKKLYSLIPDNYNKEYIFISGIPIIVATKNKRLIYISWEKTYNKYSVSVYENGHDVGKFKVGKDDVLKMFNVNEPIDESLLDKMKPKSPSEIKRIKKRPIQNKKGEYRWIFAWEGGGGNDVWAKDKREAKKLAFELGLPTWMPENEYAKKTLNDIKEEFGLKGYRTLKKEHPDVKDDEPGWSQGSHVNYDTLRKETLGVKGQHDDALYRLSI